MKIFLTLIVLVVTHVALSQSDMPLFLQGTWKIEEKESYEHWDRLGDNRLKGFSYSLENGEMLVSEYLDIVRQGNRIMYIATVPGQNQDKSINFTLKRTDSIYSFENPAHDFPKKVVYKLLSDTVVWVRVSDGKQKGFSYKMRKQQARSGQK